MRGSSIEITELINLQLINIAEQNTKGELKTLDSMFDYVLK